MDKNVDGRPTKSFFVDMLTRDISMSAAILDLCDNALGRTFELADTDPSDYVIESENRRKPLRPYYLHVTISSSVITIADNCGGISIDRARNEVFRLGRDAEEPVDSGLSVYGIGMKRAFFKLADRVSLRSSHGAEWFDISFRVSEWKDKGDDDWNLEFSKLGARERPDSVPKNGTIIELRDLRDGVKTLIGSKTFDNDLRHRLQATYSLFVAFGLDLRYNGKSIENAVPVLASDALRPARKTLKIGKVRTVMIAGVTPKTIAATPATSGWFVYCNGRLVLEADKTRVTGWGEGLPQWHSKFIRFVGFVFFDSEDSRELPWTTTKQGLVDDSEIFLRARQEMQILARPVLDFLTRLYPADVPMEGVQERTLLEKAGPVSLADVARSDRAFQPPQPKAKVEPSVNIQYKKPVAKVDLVKNKLGRRLSASEVGSRTFDYFVKNECNE